MKTLADITEVRQTLLERFETLEDKREILKAPELKELLAGIKDVAPEDRREYGQAVNTLSKELKAKVATEAYKEVELPPIDVTAPMDVNASIPDLLPSEHGSIHPLMQEIAKLTDIFQRMGFTVEESREIDDQYHMFESLNFPKGHPARDDYDTFMTEEKDAHGDPFIAPAHTSTMQNRILKKYKTNLENGEVIAAVVPDRVFVTRTSTHVMSTLSIKLKVFM
jgi:phenylalanyl-tRNA synthetase alpha chain